MTTAEALSRGPQGLAILAEIFELAPAFIAVLRGPEHVFELANAACYEIVGEREIIGRPLREALPELMEQGYAELFDGVFRTGTPFVGKARAVLLARTAGQPLEERFVDFVVQAVTDTDGARTGVFIHGVDVTDQVRARAEVEHSRSEAE
jgi:PAS domain S-box-containing protein